MSNIPNSTPVLLVDEPDKHKVYTRYFVHLVHALVAILFVVIVIITALVDTDFVFAFYTLPIALSILIIELPFLLRRPPKQGIAKKYGLFYNKLIVRGYVYQLAAAIPASAKWRICGTSRVIAWIIWVIGLIMVFIAVVAKHSDLLDWLEENDPRDIQLHGTDDLHSLGYEPVSLE
ncbi:hypothetical protein PIIN_08103 [Serendipita indica DSM 11827]|uniref:Uncharacterized protein n=1 Tax=Serendipita indica (strain DSM 11827) TaxID=1109443 RepID=G4TS57_SERID|nr:hypothetical protein PIIN_08103 [Serendipita indica DSM 11827]